MVGIVDHSRPSSDGGTPVGLGVLDAEDGGRVEDDGSEGGRVGDGGRDDRDGTDDDCGSVTAGNVELADVGPPGLPALPGG